MIFGSSKICDVPLGGAGGTKEQMGDREEGRWSKGEGDFKRSIHSRFLNSNVICRFHREQKTHKRETYSIAFSQPREVR